MAERDYRGVDLRVRRAAAGLTGTDMARLGGVKQPNYSGMENGKRRVPPGLVRDTLIRVEQAVAQLTTDHINQAPAADADGVIVLMTYSTPAALAEALPEYSWLPVAAHQQAVGRAAATLESEGSSVRIVLQGEGEGH